jgi:hypothetical protein
VSGTSLHEHAHEQGIDFNDCFSFTTRRIKSSDANVDCGIATLHTHSQARENQGFFFESFFDFVEMPESLLMMTTLSTDLSFSSRLATVFSLSSKFVTENVNTRIPFPVLSTSRYTDVDGDNERLQDSSGFCAAATES